MNRAEGLLLELESSASKLVELAPTAGESLQGFSAHEVERLSEALAVHVHAALAAAAPAFDAAPEGSSAVGGESVEGALGILAAAAAVARAIAVEPSFGIPEKLQERAAPSPSPLRGEEPRCRAGRARRERLTAPSAPRPQAVAEALHDIIFDLHDPRASSLQGAIVELCESWWLAERPGRDELVPQTISYLLVSALHEAATAADVKRLWALRSVRRRASLASPAHASTPASAPLPHPLPPLAAAAGRDVPAASRSPPAGARRARLRGPVGRGAQAAAAALHDQAARAAVRRGTQAARLPLR